MANEPENLVLELLRGLRDQMGELRAELKADINSLRADVASDLWAELQAVTHSLAQLTARVEAGALRRSFRLQV